MKIFTSLIKCGLIFEIFIWAILGDPIKSDIAQLAADFFMLKNVGAAIIFACSTEESLVLAKHLMNAHKERYFMVSNGINAANLTLPTLMASQHFKLGVFMDLTCERNVHILQECSEIHLLNGSYSWLLWSDTSESLAVFKTFELRLDSEVVLAVPGVTLFDIYKINETWPLITTEVGSWSKAKGINLQVKPNRLNFHGIKFKGSVVLTKFETNESNVLERMVDVTLEPHLDSASRFAYILFVNLQQLYNFSLEVGVVKSWGYLIDNDGNHDGMIGQIERGEIDFGLTPASLFIHRMNKVDFTTHLWRFRTCFIFRHPPTMGAYKALVTPFSATVWACIVILITLAISVFRLVTKAYNEGSWSASILLVWGILCQQGLTMHLKILSARVLSLFVLLLGMMVYSFYSAAIVTSLLSPSPKTIRTIDQLIKSPLALGAEDTSYTRDYFMKSNDALTRHLYNTKMLSDHSSGFSSPKDGVEHMRTSPFAFYAEDATLYRPIDMTFSNSEKCSLSEIELIPPYWVSLPVKKRSPLRNIFSQGFILMQERGVAHRENRVWHSHRPECVGRGDIVSVTLETVMIAYILLLFGVILSLFILFFEKILYLMR